MVDAGFESGGSYRCVIRNGNLATWEVRPEDSHRLTQEKAREHLLVTLAHRGEHYTCVGEVSQRLRQGRVYTFLLQRRSDNPELVS